MTMLEQPLGRDALVDSALLQRGLRTALCLDESVTSAGSARSALALGSARIVNIKPARLGGLLASLAVHDLCVSRSVPVWCGGIGETGIGRAFNLALASLPGFTMPADMSPARLFLAEDLVDPTYDLDPDGTIQVPASSGNGFTVHEARVAACTTSAWESRA
jgi:O-succinylbenzoate synthase